MNLRDQFVEWKNSVLPDGAKTLFAIAGTPGFAKAWERHGKDMQEAHPGYKALDEGDEESLPGAVNTIRLMRVILTECGVELPPWKDPPFPIQFAFEAKENA